MVPAVKSLTTLVSPDSSLRESVSSLDPQVCVGGGEGGVPRGPNTPPVVWENLPMGRGAGLRLKTTLNTTCKLLGLAE